MFKNVATKIALFAFDVTTGVAKTGDAANLTAYVNKDYAGPVVLTDTSATEIDAAKAAGWYLFDVSQTEANADSCLFTGVSTTANISVVGREIFTTPNRFSALVIDAAGLADANMVKTGPTGAGTAQTARDLGASVLLAGDLSATMKTSVQTAADAAVTANTLINAMASYIDTEVAAIKAKTDNLPATPASTTNITAASGVTLAATGSAALTEDYAADGATVTLNQAIYMILAFLFEKSIAGTVLTAKKKDGATTAMTFNLDSGTTPTSITRAT